MRSIRTLLALGAATLATNVLAHPGHDAPPVHAHDFSEAAWMIAIVVIAALAVAGLGKLRRARAKKPPASRRDA
ncbi:hypothetical protein DSM104443_02534 [Usitatibacter rugosus]|uniref:MYXO-CTERM domain-containing protein n=1 Tax=Usitatibacter rugosus TaxID=2732067 RepID=A0A6M4GX60_9PROT|nr:hypothetical protein [Usitatibacter rugosus]QJR11458.1 hypothetical protein DSM104443_02534 [Usitatibacter rugosus]